MRLYIDNQYSRHVTDLIHALHEIDANRKHEVVTGKWESSFTASDTVVFLWETNKRGLSQQILKHYDDGFMVFTYRKPHNKPLDLFQLSVLLLSQWKRILKLIEDNKAPFLYTISDSTRPLSKYSPYKSK